MISSSESASHGSHDSMPSNMLAVGQPLPLVAAPRLPCPPGWAARFRMASSVTSSRQPKSSTRPEVAGRSLVGHVEPGQPVDLVAPEVDADRLLGGGGEHVDDAAPHGQLATVLDDRLAPVAHGRPAGHQLVDRHAVALGHDDRSGGGPPRGPAAGGRP